MADFYGFHPGRRVETALFGRKRSVFPLLFPSFFRFFISRKPVLRVEKPSSRFEKPCPFSALRQTAPCRAQPPISSPFYVVFLPLPLLSSSPPFPRFSSLFSTCSALSESEKEERAGSGRNFYTPCGIIMHGSPPKHGLRRGNTFPSEKSEKRSKTASFRHSKTAKIRAENGSGRSRKGESRTAERECRAKSPSDTGNKAEYLRKKNLEKAPLRKIIANFALVLYSKPL